MSSENTKISTRENVSAVIYRRKKGDVLLEEERIQLVEGDKT